MIYVACEKKGEGLVERDVLACYVAINYHHLPKSGTFVSPMR